jgi:outer membrane protein OmpA-like peptidoglycan-associated protein
MRRITTVSSLLLAALLGGCAMNLPFFGNNTPRTAAAAPAAPAAGGAAELEPVPAGTVRVVLMRAQNDRAGILNVFHGQRFHASLQPGEFTVLNMCPNDSGYFVTSLESPGQVTEVNVSRLIEMRERLSAGQQRFYRVALQDAGAVNIQPMVQTAIDWSGMNEQKRLVSRVQLNCGAPTTPAPQVAQATPTGVVTTPVAPAAPVAARAVAAADGKLTIPSDLVFPFASFTLDQRGRTQVRQRVEQFLAESGIKEVDSIVVQGHSDPIGQPHRKELVSGERAKAVAMVLSRDMGIPLNKIKAEAFSDRALLVKECPSRPVAKRDECNAPNRRVEIVVNGRR